MSAFEDVPLPARVVGDASRVDPLLPRMHPHVLRHTHVTTVLDAGVDLRDVRIAAAVDRAVTGPRGPRRVIWGGFVRGSRG